MQGAVQQGGVITTAITINGAHGYKRQVRLNDAVQISGVSVAFSPTCSIPPYTSTVTIKVDSDVSTGVYPITIRGKGGDGKKQTCEYTLTVNPTPVMPTPTPTITPIPVITSSIIDAMNNTWGWETHREDNKSSIDITSILGMTGNAIEISYDLKEKGSVSIYKEINPEKLFEKEGILFFYNASGGPTTLIIGLEYEDTTQFVSSGRATATDNWVPVEVPFHLFTSWDGDSELDDLQKVRKIVFIIENRPEQGDVYGSGWVIIDDVQTITS